MHRSHHRDLAHRTPSDVMSCYGHAWDTLLAQLPVLAIVGVATGIVVMAGSGLTQAGFLLWPLGLAFGALVVTPIKWSFASLCLGAVRGNTVEAEDMLDLRDRYREVVIAGAVCSVLVIGGLMLLVIPGVYLYLRLAFVRYLVLNEGLEALDAVRESLRLTRGIELRVGGVAVVGALGSLLGAAMMGIGAIPAMILWELAMASLFDAVIQVEIEPDEFELEERLFRSPSF